MPLRSIVSAVSLARRSKLRVRLLLVIWAGSDALIDAPQQVTRLIPTMEIGVWSGILLGAFLAFFAFIGFEDMVNIAEEVKEPRRNLPIGILLALAFTGLLYFLVVLALVLSMPLEQLAASETPLALAVAPHRARWRVHRAVFAWHLRGCPASVGLRQAAP